MNLRLHLDPSKSSFRITLEIIFSLLFMTCVLYAFSFDSHSLVLRAVGGSSLASSAFISFVRSNAFSAKPQKMLGSYFISISFGVFFYFLSKFALGQHLTPEHAQMVYYLMGGAVVGLTSLFMVLFQCEHPPAAGVGLGLLIGKWNTNTLLILTISIIILSVAATILKHTLDEAL